MDFHVSLVDRKDLSGEIYRQVRRGILDGRLRPGDALPPTRTLARSLSVSRTTVTVAYDRLLGEGFVNALVGAGTFVASAAPIRRARAGETGTQVRSHRGPSGRRSACRRRLRAPHSSTSGPAFPMAHSFHIRRGGA
jgi:DNA-binding GntR family transcriptional regulator